MSTDFDSFTNRGEYFSAHYFAEQLGADLKKQVFTTWAIQEGDERDPRKTPRELLRALRAEYLGEERRGYFAAAVHADSDSDSRINTHGNPEWAKKLAEWHQLILRALGYGDGDTTTELTAHRAGRDHRIPVAYHNGGIVALDCGWSADTDAALDTGGAGRLLTPFSIGTSETYETGPALASWLFQSELDGAGGPRPRFILLLCGGVLVLADRRTWNEGRYLAVSLDTALERNDRTQQGELATIAALLCRTTLVPGDNQTGPILDSLLEASSTNAAGVSTDLRYGLQRSVEVIANEVLHRMAEPGNNVTPAEVESPAIPFARELTRETLRYLYRILFLLYAEARPELGILPADDGSYEAGYSMSRLRELVARSDELVEEEAKNSFHLYESLDILFTKVNKGHREYGTEPDDDQPGDDPETRKKKRARRSEDRGLRFEPLRSELFEPGAIRLIGRTIPDPHCDDDPAARRLDLRLRNQALHEVLRLLTMKKGKRGERGGFISYRNLGINQLGAVYEGLMSYTGIVAGEELCEVAKGGDPEQGSWLIPAHARDRYPDSTLVQYNDDDARKGLRGVKKYKRGEFVYRLAGRDRQTSASYYTPESLTKVTVELALRYRLDQGKDEHGNTVKTRASELLKFKICEPALGSGAFLNEAINQLADEYLRRRQEELGTSIPTADALTEKQKAKAYIALHNAYGVDLNATGVELAEVSLWLNAMHPGMRAPWFGLHLRRGNSLIGARRAVFAGDDVSSSAKEWLKAKGALAPSVLPLLKDARHQELPKEVIHQFLLPAPGWAAVTGSKEAKQLAGAEVAQLAAWRRGILQRPKRNFGHLEADGSPKIDPKTGGPKVEARSQFTRLRDLAGRVEFLWSAVLKRMEISEREIARRITVWQADPNDPEFAFLQYPEHAVPKEKVLEDLFNAVDTPYWRLKTVMDAWCALWFWPADKAGLLDGTDGEYTATTTIQDVDDLREVLDGLPAREKPPAPEPVTEVKSRLEREQQFVDMLTLFPVDGEQTSFDDLASDTENDSEHGVVRKKIGAARSRKNSGKKPQPQRRRIIPLVDLDDWIDFLEAMLGRSDVPEETLLSTFQTLEELKDFETTLTGYMQMDTGNPEDRFPWLRQVRDIATAKGFLHWELEFAPVFARSGGFDIQVGNPPWVRPRWDESAVLAEYEPWFKLQDNASEQEKDKRRAALLEDREARSYTLAESTDIAGQVSFFGSPQMYPLLAGTQPDLYRAFMIQVWAHSAGDGAAGMVHPDSHFAGKNEASLREESYRRLRIHGDFFNAYHRFFQKPVGEWTHFGVHIYGAARDEIGFDHLSWLVSTEALRLSPEHDGSGIGPGIRYKGGAYDERPHRARVVRVDRERLSVWQRLLDDTSQPVAEARLLSPVSIDEASAIQALADYPVRLARFSPRITRGYDESGAKKSNLIQYNTDDFQPQVWRQVILKGIQLGVATPIFKSYDANPNDPYGVDLVSLPEVSLPDTEYVRVHGRIVAYLKEQDHWVDYRVLNRLRHDEQAIRRARRDIAEGEGCPEVDVSADKIDGVLARRARRRYSSFYRLAWREMIASNTERSLYPALIPPGAAHVNSVRSCALSSNKETCMMAGFLSAIPIDYLLKIIGVGHLDVALARRFPAPQPGHPLESALLLRTLRLNCLTRAYGALWSEIYDPAWADRGQWACEWPGLPGLEEVTPDWHRGIPLRTERARRAALVEIDALVAVWLGMDAEALIAAYRGRFFVLQKFEAVTWFDANGWKLAGDARTYGQRQTKDSWKESELYRTAVEQDRDPSGLPVPDGYTAPLYRANREAEMRAAHAVFQRRLDEAVARGEWDPVTQEVPKS
ncbi:hypothetical protein [Nocardia fusca]|uniref:site-specific DNA-methyltransferase (adenine-specific) n=1 Tax=Nocardia fusca TaxID=941183 RepID=A0ABV3FI15_9NOCA